MATSANGSPTKEFFVEMLTRDIELMMLYWICLTIVWMVL